MKTAILALLLVIPATAVARGPSGNFYTTTRFFGPGGQYYGQKRTYGNSVSTRSYYYNAKGIYRGMSVHPK